MSTKNRLSERISEADWAAGKREKSMIKAIIKSTMLDGTPKDATDVRKSIRELLMDSRTYPLRKAPEMSSTETQQVLAQVSALLAGLDSGQAATPGWAKKAASYKRKVIPYLTEGLLIYISGPTSTTGTASAKNTGTAAGEHSLQGSNSTLLGESASTSSKKDEKTTELQWLRRIYLASLLLLRTPQVLRTLVPLPNITPSTWTAPGYQILRCWAKMRLRVPKCSNPAYVVIPQGKKTKQKHHQKNTHTHTHNTEPLFLCCQKLAMQAEPTGVAGSSRILCEEAPAQHAGASQRETLIKHSPVCTRLPKCLRCRVASFTGSF
jgi:hypothetical protein